AVPEDGLASSLLAGSLGAPCGTPLATTFGPPLPIPALSGADDAGDEGLAVRPPRPRCPSGTAADVSCAGRNGDGSSGGTVVAPPPPDAAASLGSGGGKARASAAFDAPAPSARGTVSLSAGSGVSSFCGPWLISL